MPVPLPAPAQARRNGCRGARPLETLSPAEAETLEAVVARLIPSEPNAPGAREARATHYIDRALGGALAAFREIYSSGLPASTRSPRPRAPGSRSSRRRTRTNCWPPWNATTSRDSARRRGHVLQPGAGTHAPGHVRRSVLWREPRLRGLGSAALPGRPPGRDGRRTAAGPDAPASSTCRPTTTRCSRGPRPARASTGHTRTVMATELPKTDVVVVGLGAAGGVAVLPLVNAGLEVVGLEAGTWLAPADFAPDELRNNFRGWPQAVQKANREIPTHRPNASAPLSPRLAIHPMMNAVGGTTLHYWAQSWRLNPWDFKVVSETRRRYGASRIPRGSTVEDWPFGLEELEPFYDKVEVELGVSGPGRQHPRHHRPPGQHLRGRAGPRLSDASASRHGLHEHDGWRGALARVARVSRTGRDQLGPLSEPVGVRVPRILRARRLPRQCQRLDRGHDHPEGTTDQEAERRHRGARHQDRRRSQRPGHRRAVSEGADRVHPAGQRGPAGQLRVRERPPAALVHSRWVSPRAVEQPRPGGTALLQPQPAPR